MACAFRAENHDIRIEGEAADYAALSMFMGRMEDDSFFPAEMMLEHAEQETAANRAARVRFTLRSTWQEAQ